MKDNILITVALKIEFQEKIPDNCELIYTGVGKVNATYNLTRKLESMNKLPSYILNYGTAGSKDLKIGEIVDCTRFIQHDMYLKEFGLNPGQTAFEFDQYEQNEPPVILNFKSENKNPIKKNYICASGDKFVTKFEDNFLDIEKTYNEKISVIDMEAYALAKVSYLYKIPFISFKYITDNLNSTGVSDWEQHVRQGANQFRELLTKI
ncbi:MAG: 5'-methylthioadenosine nucleosidase [Chloroflexi bacterium]|nr:5'-methylthioadenosine nucleosidase [Chloroflexota bacterium]